MKVIFEKSKIKKIVSRLKQKKIKTVMCHGVFDVLHYGHILHFEEAKKMGNKLIVSVTSDQYAKKAFNRPIFNLKVRMSTLASLEMIDYIIPSQSKTAIENLNLIKPSVYCKGPDYFKQKDLTYNLNKEIQAVKNNNGIIKYTSGKQFSSSSIINNLGENFNDKQRFFLNKLKKKYSFEKLKYYLDKTYNSKVNVIGESIIDKYSMCEPIGVSSKDPFLVFKSLNTDKFSGGSLAIANNISSYLKKLNVISPCSNKNKIKKELKNKISNNINIKFIEESNYIDVVKNRFVDIYSKVKLLGVYDVGHELLSKKNETKFKNLIKKNIKDNFYIIADYGHGFISNDLARFISNSKIKYTLNAQLNSSNRGYHGLLKYKNPLSVVINENELRYELKDRNSDILDLIRTLKKN